MTEAVAIYILAGGRSARFGSDKARAVIGGRTVIQHVASELSRLGGAITVVAGRADQYADLGLRTIPEHFRNAGPLAGIHAALCDADGAWAVVVSCDLVGVRAEWVDLLLSARRDDLQAVAFRHERWEPLLAAYRTSLRAEIARRIVAGQTAPRKLLDEVASLALPMPPDWRGVVQVNTPAELEQFCRQQRSRFGPSGAVEPSSASPPSAGWP